MAGPSMMDDETTPDEIEKAPQQRGLGSMTAPAETLAAIREIDPGADLLYLGENEWILGVRGPNPGAQARINRSLRALEPYRKIDHNAGREFELLQIYATGFKPIMLYRLGELGMDAAGEMVPITMGWIVEDFRIRDFNWRVRPAHEIDAETRLAVSLDEGNRRRTEIVREKMEQEAGEMFRHVFKKARSFVQRVAIPTGG